MLYCKTKIELIPKSVPAAQQLEQRPSKVVVGSSPNRVIFQYHMMSTLILVVVQQNDKIKKFRTEMIRF